MLLIVGFNNLIVGAVLRKKEMIMLLIIGFNNLIVGAVLGRRGRRKGSRGGRTRPARPSYLVRLMQIYLVFIPGQTNTNTFGIHIR